MHTFKRLSIIVLISSVLYACNDNTGNQASTSLKLETTEQKASYSFGVDVATRLKQQGVKIDVAALNKGIEDAYSDTELALDDAARTAAKTQFQTELREKLVKQQAEIAAKNMADGQAFLAENAKKEGVITTDSGLQYKVLTSGDGAQPKASDTVTTHYQGTLIDGRVFDSSIKRGQPASFPVQGVIKGWTEALQLMHVGDKWQLFVPSDLAYGASQRSELIGPNSTLVFEVELLSIKGDKTAEAKTE